MTCNCNGNCRIYGSCLPPQPEKTQLNPFRPEDHVEKIGRVYEKDGENFLLDGIILTEEDWYWAMCSLTTGKYVFLSCVADPENFDYDLVYDAPEDPMWRFKGTHPYVNKEGAFEWNL